MISELQYRINSFEDNFNKIKGQSIALYGTAKNAEAIIKKYEKAYRFVCLISNGEQWNRMLYGKIVLDIEQAMRYGVENIILAAKTDSAFYIYDRIANICAVNGVKVWDMYGNDMAECYRKNIESIVTLPYLSKKVLYNSIDQFDCICVQAQNTLFTCPYLREEDFWKEFEHYLGTNGIEGTHLEEFVSKLAGKNSFTSVYERLDAYLRMSAFSEEESKLIVRSFDKYVEQSYGVRQPILDVINEARKRGKQVYIFDNEDEVRLDKKIIQRLLSYNKINGVKSVITMEDRFRDHYEGFLRKMTNQVEGKALYITSSDQCGMFDFIVHKLDTFRVLSVFEYGQLSENSRFAVKGQFLETYENRKALLSFLNSACREYCFISDKYEITPEHEKLYSEFLNRKNEREEDDSISYRPVLFDDVNIHSEIDSYEKLDFVKYDEPTVSIVIPVYNQFGYTYNCLKSILNHSGNVKYEVIVGDDCSNDQVSHLEEVVSGITVIHNKTNLKFLLNCNNAAKYAKGKYILFLNNDTQVQPDWLEPLVSLIESDTTIGMVGSKLVYPNGHLQEAGGIFWNDASAWNYGRGSDPEKSEFNYVRDVDYISGASIMLSKSLWQEIGGFDERFAPAYCEDSDLAFEVRKHGYRVVYQPRSVVAHFEGVSNGTDTSQGIKKYQIDNNAKFLEKWREVLVQEHFPNGTNVFVARDRSAKKKCILMVDHYIPQFDKDAGSRTVYAYLCLFVKMGYNVKFIGDNFYHDVVYAEKLQEQGVEILYGSYYANNWKTWVCENSMYFDYVFLNRPHISENYIDFLKENTHAKIIYYGHDLHFLREMRQYELTGDESVRRNSDNWKQREFALMKKADVVYYPSEVEVQEIAKIDDGIDAKAIVAYIFSNIRKKKYNFAKRKDILFVGGFGHTPNIDAVLWFCSEIFPLILKENSDIRFHVVGSKTPDEIRRLESENIIIHGFLSDEELAKLYSECRMSVIPLRYGAGIKGKVIEAMSNGVPIVTTSVGAEGIVGGENIFAVEDDPHQFANKVIELYSNKDYLENASNNSYEYIKKNFSEKAAWKVIGHDFE